MNDLIPHTAITKLKRTNLGDLILSRKGLKEKMDALNKWDAKLVDGLVANITKAKDPKAAIKLYREAQFWAQTGMSPWSRRS